MAELLICAGLGIVATALLVVGCVALSRAPMWFIYTFWGFLLVALFSSMAFTIRSANAQAFDFGEEAARTNAEYAAEIRGLAPQVIGLDMDPPRGGSIRVTFDRTPGTEEVAYIAVSQDGADLGASIVGRDGALIYLWASRAPAAEADSLCTTLGYGPLYGEPTWWRSAPCVVRFEPNLRPFDAREVASFVTLLQGALGDSLVTVWDDSTKSVRFPLFRCNDTLYYGTVWIQRLPSERN